MEDTTTTNAPPSWDDIATAGGIPQWINQHLRRQGLLDETTDPARLSAAELKAFKARREEERRIRKLLQRQAWVAYRRAHIVHLGTGVFYHDTPDSDRYDLLDPEVRRLDNNLPPLKDAPALAQTLGISIPRLRGLCYHREVDTGSHYHRWTIPKRDGSPRLISSPKPELKRIQRWLLHNIAERLPVHGNAHGFLAGRGIQSNATVHAGAKLVIKLDLKDFYPTITWRRIKGLFRKAGYGEQVATLLALLCTEAPREQIELHGKTHHVATGPRSLPQGAPTSPALTNALCLRLDTRLTGLADKLGFRYSRYADDLTFSWHSPDTPPAARLTAAVTDIVEAEGFTVHPAKTRSLRAGRRQKVTGLVVNAAAPDQPPARVPRDLVRKLRAALHNRLHGKPGGDETLAQLHGWAAYIHMTDPAKARPFFEQLQRLADEGAA